MVISFFDRLLGILFPEFAAKRYTDKNELRSQLDDLKKEFRSVLDLNADCLRSQDPENLNQIFDQLQIIRNQLLLDIDFKSLLPSAFCFIHTSTIPPDLPWMLLVPEKFRQ